MTLDELFNHGRDFAKFAFNDQGYIHPMWIVETAEGELFPVMVEMGDREEKEQAIGALKAFLKAKKAVRCVCMVEAWVYESKKGEKLDDIMDRGPIRDHPERKEIIHITAEDKYHSRSGYFYIVRPDAGKPYLSTLKRLPEDCEMKGLFTHLLESSEAVN